MLINRFAAGAAGLIMLAGPAFAQSTTQPASPPPPAANTSAGSMHFITDMKAGDWRASKLKGVNVYNSNNEKIGDINEILIDKSGNIEAAVVGVGGFLGMGEHDVAVPFNQLKPVEQPVRTSSNAPATNTTAPSTAARSSNDVTGSVRDDRGYPDHFLLDMTKDQLKAAPQFSYNKK